MIPLLLLLEIRLMVSATTLLLHEMPPRASVRVLSPPLRLLPLPQRPPLIPLLLALRRPPQTQHSLRPKRHSRELRQNSINAKTTQEDLIPRLQENPSLRKLVTKSVKPRDKKLTSQMSSYTPMRRSTGSILFKTLLICQRKMTTSSTWKFNHN
jgi:hypothetical protein